MESFAEVRRRVRNAALRAYEVCVFTALLVGALEMLPAIAVATETERDAADAPATASMPPQCGNTHSSPAVITR